MGDKREVKYKFIRKYANGEVSEDDLLRPSHSHLRKRMLALIRIKRVEYAPRTTYHVENIS